MPNCYVLSLSNDTIPGMILLKKDQYDLANNFFDQNYPNITFVKAIIENKMPGNIFVDNLDTPKFSIILTDKSFGFISKNYDLDAIKYLCALLKSKFSHNYKLVFDNSALINEFDFFGIPIVDRQHFSLNIEKFFKKDINYPEDVRLHAIDQNLFYQCNWKERLYELYKTKEAYLSNAVGCGVLFENKIISEAHAVLSEHFCELGVFTDSAFRNRGLSTIVCHFLISQCLKYDFSIKWSCDITNTASQNLAIKLGFEMDYKYRVLSTVSV